VQVQTCVVAGVPKVYAGCTKRYGAGTHEVAERTAVRAGHRQSQAGSRNLQAGAGTTAGSGMGNGNGRSCGGACRRAAAGRRSVGRAGIPNAVPAGAAVWRCVAGWRWYSRQAYKVRSRTQKVQYRCSGGSNGGQGEEAAHPRHHKV